MDPSTVSQNSLDPILDSQFTQPEPLPVDPAPVSLPTRATTYVYAFVTNIFDSSSNNAAYARFSEDEMKQQPVRIQGEKVLSRAFTNAPPEVMDFDYAWVTKNLVSEKKLWKDRIRSWAVLCFTFPRQSRVHVPFRMGWSSIRNGFLAYNKHAFIFCPIPRRRMSL